MKTKNALLCLMLALALCLLCSVAMAASVEHHQEGVKITYNSNAGAPDTIEIVPDGSILFEGNTLDAIKVSKVAAEPNSSSWEEKITFTHGEPCVQDGLTFHVLYKDNEDKLYVRAYGAHQVGEFKVWDHEWVKSEEPKSEATCTAKAVYTYTCEVCGATKDVEEGELAPHNYMEHITEKPTCTEDGKAIMKCSVCGHEDGKEYIAKAGGHSFELHITAPECDPKTKEVKKGEAYVQCSKCGMYVKLVDGKLSKWESFGDKVEEAYVVNTKEVEKDIDEARYHVLTGDWSYTAHDWTGWHEISNTCEAAGYRIRYCNRCGFDQTAAYPDPYDYRNYPCAPEWEVVVLNENGYHCTAELGKDFVIKCAICGGTANGHMFDALGTAKNAPDAAGNTYTVAQETADGVSNKYIRLTFTISGGTTEYGWIGNTHLDHILTHVYLEDAKYLLKDANDAKKAYYTEERPTCVENTYKYYRCINEDVVNYQDAQHPTYAVVDKPMTNHNWGAWKMMEAPEPEKNAPGRWVRTCTNKYCLDTEGNNHAQEEIKTFDYPCKTEADHAWVKDVVITAATCTTDGLKGEVCSKCNKVKDGSEVVIPAAHTWGEAKELTAATCTEKGVAIKTCTVCGAIESVEIAAKGHTPEDVAEVPATCKTEGTKAGKKCSVCGEKLSGFETIPVDENAHVWGKAEAVKAPTCTEAGSEIVTCEVCGKIEKRDVDALGHTWDDGKITKEATKDAKGEKTYTCTVCGETKTEEVDYVITADPKYTITALTYDGMSVKGKLVHDEDTLTADELTVRVTFFLSGNYYMATIGEVEADGTFTVDGVGNIEYISLVVNGSLSVNPEKVIGLGSGEITVK